jgi:lipopolysaccharide/colanic/teichoic acid biosynthesis glycosyltransferase
MRQSVIKRAMDGVSSGVALLVLLPVLGLIAGLIRLESQGSPLFFQKRVGQGCKPFYIVKFRSMVKDADKIGQAWTQKGDARITRIGGLIRRTSLDELPQLWNVMTGDMSLVGPRPIMASDEPLYTKEQWLERHSMRPGLTGLAQVNGRSSLSFEQQTAYDIDYVKNWSLIGDMSILFKTIQVVIFDRENAN